MFNTIHNHAHSREYVPYEKTVTVNEHRAPTDKSVELLNEFEEKARANIIDSVVIDTNELKAVAIAYQVNEALYFNKTKFYTKFVLNGKEYKSEGVLDQEKFKNLYAFGRDTQSRNRFIADILIEQFSKAIATELIKQLPGHAGAVIPSLNA